MNRCWKKDRVQSSARVALAAQRASRAVLVGVVVSLATSGCSLINPYLRAPQLDSTDNAAAGLPSSALPENQALLSAVAAAAAQRSLYYSAVGDRAKLRNGLPLALIPLGAAALYKGIAADAGTSTRNLLLKEGLVGATLYGLGSYYTSTTREQVYLAGAKALSCSIYAMTPYYVPDDLASALGSSNLSALNHQLHAVESATQPVRELRQKIAAGDAAGGVIDAEIRRAQASVAAAKKTLRQAVSTRSLLLGAGARLRATVENVVSEVDVQIARLEPDPAVILTLAASLPTTAKQFAPGATFAAAATAPKPQLGVATALAPVPALRAEVDQLDAATASVQFALDVIAVRIQSTPKLDTCEVQSVKGRIDISPSEASVDMKVGETRQFVIRSTVGIPSVEWVGPFRTTSGTPVEMTKQVAGNTLLVQVSYSAAVEGISQVTFEVSDSSQELKKAVTLELLPATVAPKPAPAPATKPPAKPAAAPAAKPAAKAAGAHASATTAAPSASAPAKHATPAVPLQQNGPRNSIEQALDADRLKALQARLNVPSTGIWDTATRDAITGWQAAHQWPTRDGTLQSATLAAIMK